MQLSEACRLYNAALQERRDAYRTHRKSLNYYDQANQLKEIRDGGGLALPNYHCTQDVLKRVEKTFKAFFNRIKKGQKPGFPRFKPARRYDSITFPSHGDGNKLLEKHLRVVSAGINRHGVTNERVVKKGIANHLESESCEGDCKAALEALTGTYAGRA
jgi:putative transposase